MKYDNVKDILMTPNCKSCLAKDDLDGLYKNLGQMVFAADIEDWQVGEITAVLEKCGVKTTEYFEDKGYIPDFYLCTRKTLGSKNEQWFPMSWVRHLAGFGDAIVFPYTIKSIGNYAFYKCDIPVPIVDLRGIDRIGTSAFEYSALSEIIIDDNLPSGRIGGLAFCNTGLYAIHYPSTMDGEYVLYDLVSHSIDNPQFIQLMDYK